MKTAEELMNSFGKFPNDNKEEDRVYRIAKIPERLLPPVNFWNSVVTESDIKQIQLDAMKEGMLRAARNANQISCRPGGGTALEVKQAILSDAEQLTEKDLL